MTYLQRLQAENTARLHFERDELRMKELIMKINDYHTAYDGEFLKSLENFLTTFNKEKHAHSTTCVSSK
jgi:hypothetical protein